MQNTNRGDVNREKILDFSKGYRVPGQKSDEVALKELLVRINSNTKSLEIQQSKKRIYFYFVSVAASILLFIGICISQNEKVKVISKNGEQKCVYLPDSSKVIMNAATTIKFNPKQWNKHRIVELDGEAFFIVKKGKAFEVISKQCITTVLGTSFNVSSRENYCRISCFSGKVSVKVKNNVSVAQILTPGYETNVNKENTLTEPIKFKPDKTATWQKGEFYFSNQPLSDVIKELERQYNVKIKSEVKTTRYFTGYFFKNDIQQALRLICVPMQLTYSIHERDIIIRENNKN